MASIIDEMPAVHPAHAAVCFIEQIDAVIDLHNVFQREAFAENWFLNCELQHRKHRYCRMLLG